MKPLRLFLILLIALISFSVKSQNNDCAKDFDYLIRKIKEDYPGYQDKVTKESRHQLIDLENNLRNRTAKHPDSCRYYFEEYTRFFKDYHLRVRPVRRKSNQVAKKPELMTHSTYGENIEVNLDSLYQRTINSKGIEGIWVGYREEFAVFKHNNRYLATPIKWSGWKTGQIISEFKSVNDSLFELTSYSLSKNDRTYKNEASIQLGGKILEIRDNTRFVRKSNSELTDKATLYSYIPKHPNGTNTYPVALYLNEHTFYLRVPSFGNEMSNEAVKKHWNDIISRPNLIIDIRNNGGGQDEYYKELAKLIYSKPYESKGVEWFASRGNIKLFEDALKNGETRNGEEGIKWTKDLLEVMKKNIGGFVIHPHYSNETEVIEYDTIYPMPRNIGVIMNENNASSAEQFLLTANQSDKVILFGNQNSAGILDYSNITSTPFPSGNYELWCPMTRSKRLPENPIDNIGISPDVNIPFPATEQLYDKLDSWVYFVKNYLELMDVKQ